MSHFPDVTKVGKKQHLDYATWFSTLSQTQFPTSLSHLLLLLQTTIFATSLRWACLSI